MANGINRYYLPAQQQVANTYVPIPFEEILAVSQAQQKAFDDLEAKRQALEDTDFYALDPDLDYVTNKQNEMLKDTESVVDAYSSGDLRKARKMYQDIDRKWKKELNPLTGITGGAMAQYDKRAEFYKALKENKDLNPTQIQTAMDYFDEQYAKSGGIGLDPKNMGAYSTEELAKWINPTEWADKYGKGFLSDLDAEVTVGPDGGYIIKKKGSHEYVKEEDIHNTLMKYAMADPEMMAWLEQGERMGYSSKDMMLEAITGASKKYGFDKRTADESWSKDWLYERALDEEKEAAAAKPTVSTSKENVQYNPLTDALMDIKSGALFSEKDGDYVAAFEIVVSGYQREINVANDRIEQIDAMLRNTNIPLSNEVKNSLIAERQQLQGKIENASIERDWYTQMENDVLSQALSPLVDHNPNFEGMTYKEIYTELKENKDILKENINIYDELTSSESDALLETLNSEYSKSRLEFTHNAKIIYSQNKQGYIEARIAGQPYTDLPDIALEHNAKIQKAKDNISSSATYMGDALQLEMPASGITLKDAQGVLGYLSNKEGTGVIDKVGAKVQNYANNITTTNLVHTFTPDQVGKNPALNAVQESLNTGDNIFGDFRPINPSTNKPGAPEKISSSENVSYQVNGIEWFPKEGMMLKVIKKVDNSSSSWFTPNTNTVQKGYIKIDDGTNLPEIISSQYLQKVKQANSQGKVDQESERAAFASTPMFSNIYKIINEFQEKTPDLYEVDKQGDLSIYKIPNAPYYDVNGNIAKGDLMISVDKESKSGEIYNFYGLNVSEEDIKSGKADFEQVSGNQLEYVVAGTLLQNL